MWNKKYPICITQAQEQMCGEDIPSSEVAKEYGERGDKPQWPEQEGPWTTTLYLFGCTGREKEEWYQHLLLAAREEPHGGFTELSLSLSLSLEECSAEGLCQGSTDDLAPMLGLRELAGSVRERILLDYSSYMAHFVAVESSNLTPSPGPSQPASPTNTLTLFPSNYVPPPAGGGWPAWLNALVGRVAHKIQKKLRRIRVRRECWSYFMNELTLAELDMGTCLWLELEVVYTGSLQMTLETKMNLFKLCKENMSETDSNTETSRLMGFLAFSDSIISAGSTDEEEPIHSASQGTFGDRNMPPGADGHGGGSISRKILCFVDKITKSKYFHKATGNEYIKKKIAELSNTPPLLTVEVLECSGTLAINIPPPTDRTQVTFRIQREEAFSNMSFLYNCKESILF
uniref:PH domain-containing protein n=1 Tax=Electrophorus electricus TaxID=8005 RepID=A0A4W4E9T8_ELEEL